jgi:hypothetical protein
MTALARAIDCKYKHLRLGKPPCLCVIAQ